MIPRAVLAALALAGTQTGTAVRSEEPEPEERVNERLHAPLPLYTFDWPETWPRSIDDPDVIAGCASRVGFGDWHFIPDPTDAYGNEYWLRVANYGVFHCAAIFRQSDDRADLAEAAYSYGLFVRIGEGRAKGKTYELWVLQQGFVPGSSYTLLARDAAGAAVAGEGVISRFQVLQSRCPPGRLRVAKGLDIFTTRYCAIETRGELLALARRMLREPVLGDLIRSDEKGPETEASDP